MNMNKVEEQIDLPAHKFEPLKAPDLRTATIADLFTFIPTHQVSFASPVFWSRRRSSVCLASMEDLEGHSTDPPPSAFIVVDTNFLLSDLTLVMSVQAWHSKYKHVIIIPWTVIEERMIYFCVFA